jgi:hypothetical protein
MFYTHSLYFQHACILTDKLTRQIGMLCSEESYIGIGLYIYSIICNCKVSSAILADNKKLDSP